MKKQFSYDDYMLCRAMHTIMDDEVTSLPTEEELADEIRVSDSFREKMAFLLRKSSRRQTLSKTIKAAAAIIIVTVLVFSVKQMMDSGTLYKSDETAGATNETTAEQRAYLEYMADHPDEAAPYTLFDINGDGVCELIQHGDNINFQLYNYYNDKVTLIDTTKDGSFRIYPETKTVWTSYGHLNRWGESWKEISKSGAREVAVKEWEQDPKTGKRIKYSYKVNGNKTDKAGYQAAIKTLKKGDVLEEKDFDFSL